MNIRAILSRETMNYWNVGSSRRILSWLSRNVPYSLVKPGTVSPLRKVPSTIRKPPYILTGQYPSSSAVTIKSESEIKRMRDVCRLARQILNETKQYVKPGVSTDEIDGIVHELAIAHGAYPSPLQYRGFPKSCCTSVNNVALHGIPDDRPLVEGDILNLDVTIYKDQLHGDLSETLPVGNIDHSAKELISTTKEALDKAISICGPGVLFSSIGKQIDEFLEDTNFSVIPQICGHGIGYTFHEQPDVFHVDHGSELRMQPGMVFTIEPCVSEGGIQIRLLADGWTCVSVDDSRSAQFEHTVAITDHGCVVLTEDEE